MIKREDQSAERNNVIIERWKPQNQPEAREDESTWNVNTSVPALAKTLEKPIPINTHDCMVGDRGSDMGAGWACGLRLFQTDEKKGIGAVIERILDSKDSGDSFNPVR